MKVSQHLVTENDEIIRADVYIDCTGFPSMLLEETLEEFILVLKIYCSNDSAVAIPNTIYRSQKQNVIPYKSNYNESRMEMDLTTSQ